MWGSLGTGDVVFMSLDSARFRSPFFHHLHISPHASPIGSGGTLLNNTSAFFITFIYPDMHHHLSAYVITSDKGWVITKRDGGPLIRLFPFLPPSLKTYIS